MVGFEKIMKHKSQRGNQPEADKSDRSRNNPHRVGSEDLNILYGCLVVGHEFGGGII